MRLAMIKAGHWEIQNEDGTTKHVMQSVTLPQVYGHRPATLWYVDDDISIVKKSRDHDWQLGSRSLTAMVKDSGTKYNYTNHPGPLRILEKAFG